VTVAEAIGDLPDVVVPSGKCMEYKPVDAPSVFMKEMRLDSSGRLYSKSHKRKRAVGPKDPLLLHNHHTKEIQAKRAALIALLAPGAKADSLPKSIWNGARPEKWRRLHPDLPSYTILAQMHRDLSEWVHPKLERWITVREAARLQSFHDGFVFKSSEWQMLKQVGNAVPPLLAYAVARMVFCVVRATEGKPDVIGFPNQSKLNAGKPVHVAADGLVGVDLRKKVRRVAQSRRQSLARICAPPTAKSR
jgi:DNA (cytosine-5)-methyltransferase 1